MLSDFLAYVFLSFFFIFSGLFIGQIFCTFFQFEKFLILKMKSMEDRHEHKEE